MKIINAILWCMSILLMAGTIIYISLSAIAGVEDQMRRCNYEQLAEGQCKR